MVISEGVEYFKFASEAAGWDLTPYCARDLNRIQELLRKSLFSWLLGTGGLSPGKNYSDLIGAHTGLVRSPAVHNMDLALYVGMGKRNDGLFKAVMHFPTKD